MPTALQFQHNLKLICLSQYLKNTSKGNYDQDEGEFLLDYLDVIHVTKPVIYSQVKLPKNFVVSKINLSNREVNSLYNIIIGYLTDSIKKCSKTCPECLNSVESKSFKSTQYSRLVQLKCFKKNCLFFCNVKTFT